MVESNLLIISWMAEVISTRTIQLKEMLVLFFTCASILGGLALIFVILYARKKRQKTLLMSQLATGSAELLETEKQLKESVEAELTMKLQLKEKDVSLLALEITRKRQWMEELKQRLSNLTHDEKITEVQAWLTEGLLLDWKQEDLVEQMKDVNKQFYLKLDEQFTNLTASERQLRGLIRLNLNTKEIAMSRQVEPASVKTARKRLRKKLGIEPGGDIYGMGSCSALIRLGQACLSNPCSVGH